MICCGRLTDRLLATTLGGPLLLCTVPVGRLVGVCTAEVVRVVGRGTLVGREVCGVVG